MHQSGGNTAPAYRRRYLDHGIVTQGRGQERTISSIGDSAGDGLGFALLYAEGGRPAAAEIERILTQADLASLGRQAGSGDFRLDLVAGGLTWEMRGLSPGAPLPLPSARHFYGTVDNRESFPFEAVSLEPAVPNVAREELLPLVQMMAETTALIAGHSPARAVFWRPAASWMDAGYFIRLVKAWRANDIFPALALVGIERRADGGVSSDGLTLFVGHELKVDPKPCEHPSDTMKRAVRDIARLVREKGGPAHARIALSGSGPRPAARVPQPRSGASRG